jgi:hypothetical protein
MTSSGSGLARTQNMTICWASSDGLTSRCTGPAARPRTWLSAAEVNQEQPVPVYRTTFYPPIADFSPRDGVSMTIDNSKAEPGHINFSPTGFRIVAEDLLLCYESFKPEKFSIVPFFLCCRAIELGFKALHLETRSQRQVKFDFGHDLKGSYDALPSEMRSLTSREIALLEIANARYKEKAFEYMHPFDAGMGFSRFPALEDLAMLAKLIVSLAVPS